MTRNDNYSADVEGNIFSDVIWGAFIHDKRFFGSAVKEILDAVPDRKERFPGDRSSNQASLQLRF